MSDAARRPSTHRTLPIALGRLLAAVPDAVVLSVPSDASRDAARDGAPDAAQRQITHLTADSREAGAGTLFVCVRGLAADGHRFAAEVAAAGAVALLTDRDVDLGSAAGEVVVIRVADTRVACGPLAAAFFGAPSQDLQVIGITGTNGKTTTSYLVRAACEAAAKRTGVLGTVGYAFGDTVIEAPHTTPDAIHFQSLLAGMRNANEVRPAG